MSAPKTRQELLLENAELREKLAAVRDHVEEVLEEITGEADPEDQD